MTWSPFVVETMISQDADFPLVVESRKPAKFLDFTNIHKEEIEKAIDNHGAVLFRGFDLSGERSLVEIFESIWSTPLPYTYRSTPRTDVGKGIYTATEYPAALEIPMHNENAYQRDWPMRIGFHCVNPSSKGGQTPLANVARVTARIDAAIVAEFRERAVLYVRNYRDGFDLPWQKVFQTESKERVEEFCQENKIGFQWKPSGLMTEQVCQGTAIHPVSAQELWFNQAQLFHVSSLGAETAADMIELFGERGLPRNAYFGDGGVIPDKTIAHVRDAFEREKIVFDWQKDDVLLLDNMKIAHGRKPFVGSRRVLVSMGCQHSLTPLEKLNKSL